ncbi:MAG: AmmeMemoRadiSam system radical SAM enzyme [Candidatus Hydrogenedentes bacterium]|nr:AmmeMemoRadiSam system radical SAM enzyme [Candidatus Hydrogenedentota bacterium]
MLGLKELLENHTSTAPPALAIPEKDGAIRCVACGHRCLIRPGRAGVCKVRFNQGGALHVPWGYVAGLQVDPIEKKPFYHAFPGRDALSFGMLGCDLHCAYCQNWVTSQALRDEAAVAMPRFVTPKQLVARAVQEEAPVIVSTYNEPLITADWAAAVFEEAHKAEIVCGFVSNGNATPEVIEFLQPWVSLYKVDLKSFQDRSYRQLGCKLQTVLDTIGRLHTLGFWVEIVTLVIPEFNDTDEELGDIARFLAGISPDIPWHITAFHPDYKMNDTGRTPAETLKRAWEIGREAGLNFVYPGNLPGQFGDREHTACPGCGEILIRRHGFYVVQNRMAGRNCPRCQRDIPGVWEGNPPLESTGTGAPRALHI